MDNGLTDFVLDVLQPKSDEQKESIKKRLLTREEKKRKQLAELGIEYDFAGYAGKTVEGEKKEEVVAKEEGKKGGKKGRKSAEGAGVRLISLVGSLCDTDGVPLFM